MVVSSLLSSSNVTSSRLPHLHSFVVLTKQSSSRHFAHRRNSTSSSSSSSSSYSAASCGTNSDESDASDLEVDDCSIVYESYAAVTKRSSHPFIPMSWDDLQLAQISGPIDALGATLRQKRRSSIDGGNPLESTALELCFEFLTIKELLQSVVHVCVLFHDVVVQSQTLLTGSYCRQWRANKMLPKSYVTLCYHDQLTLCTARRAGAFYELSTRSAVNRLPNGTYDVVNNSMLRNFATGSIDSIRGVKKLPLLSCAQALHKQISYFEVSLQASGSVGLVSISNGAARGAYGFGSREHVGWNSVSYGYHGNDGDFVFNDGTKPYGGERHAFGPLWGRASTAQCKQESPRVLTVGCGLDAGKREVFFTLNEEMVGVARMTEVLPGDYAAAVSLHAFGDRAVINAGAAPFVFDIEAFCASP